MHDDDDFDSLPRRRPMPAGLMALGIVGGGVIVLGILFLIFVGFDRKESGKPASKTPSRATKQPLVQVSPSVYQDPQTGNFYLVDSSPVAAVDSPRDTSSAISDVKTIILAGIGLLLYFAPVAVAVLRKHPNWPAIAVVCILFGWTLVGWGVALVWAFTEVRSREHRHYHYHE